MIKTIFSTFVLTISLLISSMTMAQVDVNAQPVEVNINSADADELDKHLVGIGEKKAQAIVEYRKKNGNFKSIEDLTHVKGIGEAILEKNKANIVLQ